MKYMAFVIIILLFGDNDFNPKLDTTSKCDSLFEYIKSSKNSAMGRSLVDNSIYLVYEADSFIVYSVIYNSSDIDSLTWNNSIRAFAGEDYILLLTEEQEVKNWDCLNLHVLVSDSINHVFQRRLLDNMDLRYTTYKYSPKRIRKSERNTTE